SRGGRRRVPRAGRGGVPRAGCRRSAAVARHRWHRLTRRSRGRREAGVVDVAEPVTSPLYGGVIGQDAAVALLRAAARAPVHAYLLVGPAGTGKRAAALSFGAQLV